jgi:hypothetical protein
VITGLFLTIDRRRMPWTMTSGLIRSRNGEERLAAMGRYLL